MFKNTIDKNKNIRYSKDAIRGEIETIPQRKNVNPMYVDEPLSFVMPLHIGLTLNSYQ